MKALDLSTCPDIQDAVSSLKKQLLSLYQNRLDNLILYGSWARGEATKGSDIDIVVVLEGEVVPGREIDRMIDIISEINLQFGVLLSIYPVSKRDYSVIQSPLLLNIKKEGIAI